MNGKLLDTNVIIRYIKNEGNVADLFEERDVYFSSIALGELLFGLECSARKAENVAVYAGFCSELADIKVQLKADGHPIPENDIWIASCAMSYGLTVVTADDYFSFIKGIAVERR